MIKRMDKITTLVEMLNSAARCTDDTEEKSICVIEKKGDCVKISYAELRERALKVARKLKFRGLKKGDKVIFQIADTMSFITLFWGCIYAGIIPVPLSVPIHQSEQAQAFKKVQNVLKLMDGASIFVQNYLQDFYKKLLGKHSERIICVEDFLYDVEEFDIIEDQHVEAQDIAIIQFSSGSTGLPKGVVLRHRNLIANIRQITDSIDCDLNMESCSWMPLTHDFALIGFHFSPIWTKSSQTLISTQFFLRYPIEYLKYISDKQIEFTGFPNFALEWIMKFSTPKNLKGIDLSNINGILTGAEPINCETIKRFIHIFSNYGLKETTMISSYGMSEACLGVAISDGQSFKTITLDFVSFTKHNIVKCAEGEKDTITFAKVGKPLPKVEMIVINENEEILGEYIVGEICIKGPNVMESYFHGNSSDTFTSEGYLKTGDLGFFCDGEIVVTGRKKDIIFKNGANYYYHDIEKMVEDIVSELRGRVAVFQIERKGSKGSELVLFLKIDLSKEEFCHLKEKINQSMIKRLSWTVDKIVLIQEIPKTISGKIQRYRLKEYYEDVQSV
ncbi:AMP-binding protein [Hathewaya histolytica]|uniref:AMP-binding protein n=1 Tax=Hathewaya histolytica TaxID=1498 RepID=UPI003B66C682